MWNQRSELKNIWFLIGYLNQAMLSLDNSFSKYYLMKKFKKLDVYIALRFLS